MTRDDEFYETWHRNLGNTEHRVTVIMHGYGRDPESAETFLDGFLSACPDFGPVVSQDREADTIAVTFSLHARDQEHALELAKVAWARGGAASGLTPKEVLRIELEPVEERVEFSEPAVHA